MTRNNTLVRWALPLVAVLALLSAPMMMSGCDSLPGTRTQQTTVGGAAAGAVVGAVLARENRMLGALIGGLLGAGGGYLIGAKTDWFGRDRDEVRREANRSVRQAQQNPATAQEARNAATADINGDGFVTMDEIIAMHRAGLSDRQMIDRLEATGMVFDLSEDQRDLLLDEGVSRTVVDRMLTINRAERDRLLATRDEVIGR